MSSITIGLSNELRKYMLDVSFRDDDILRQLREETLTLKEAQMQISPEQGALLSILTKILNAKKTLDIGVFTGYSSLVVARELSDNGQVVACDTSIEWTSIAKKYWKLAGVDKKVDLYLAPAIETLEKLIEDGQGSSYDFSFIDADKINYQSYYEYSLTLVKPGGIIAVDNVLWSGQVIDETDFEPATRAIRSFNEKLYQDDRVSISMVPVGDGLTLAYKK